LTNDSSALLKDAVDLRIVAVEAGFPNMLAPIKAAAEKPLEPSISSESERLGWM